MPDRSIAARCTAPSRSAGCTVASPPLRRPSGDRTASTMTTSLSADRPRLLLRIGTGVGRIVVVTRSRRRSGARMTPCARTAVSSAVAVVLVPPRAAASGCRQDGRRDRRRRPRSSTSSSSTVATTTTTTAPVTTTTVAVPARSGSPRRRSRAATTATTALLTDGAASPRRRLRRPRHLRLHGQGHATRPATRSRTASRRSRRTGRARRSRSPGNGFVVVQVQPGVRLRLRDRAADLHGPEARSRSGHAATCRRSSRPATSKACSPGSSGSTRSARSACQATTTVAEPQALNRLG